MTKKVSRVLKMMILSGVMTFLTASSIFAQNEQMQSYVDTVVLKVQFRQGDRRIDRNYMNNSMNLQAFTSAMQKYLYEMYGTVESVNIIGGASIEGSAALNRDLSDNRARRMVEILSQYVNVPDGKVSVNSRGVNWEDVLDMVKSDPLVPSKDEVIDILTYTPEDSRKAALEKLDGGRPYQYMYSNIYPYVRTGKMTVVLRGVPRHVEPAKTKTDTVYIMKEGTTNYITTLGGGCRNCGPEGKRMRMAGVYGGGRRDRVSQLDKVDSLLRVPVFAFRTNLLAPLMNVGFEVPLGNRISVGADWYYPWVWRNPDHRNCFQLLGGTAEVRYWFGYRHQAGEEYAKYRLLGHSLALIGGGGYYDFERNRDGFQGEFGMVGLDYMYAMPIGKRAGMHLEFDIALGYIGSRNKPYDVYTDGGILLHRDHIVSPFNWVGPIKAGVNLVVPIFKRSDADKAEAAARREQEQERKAQADKLKAEQKAAAAALVAETNREKAQTKAAELQAKEEARAAEARAKEEAKNAAEAQKIEMQKSKAQAKAAEARAKEEAKAAEQLAKENEAREKAHAKAAEAREKAKAKARAAEEKAMAKAEAQAKKELEARAKADAKAQAAAGRAAAKAAKENAR